MLAMPSADRSVFGSLLRYALDIDADFPFSPTSEEWEAIYLEGVRQTVAGLLFNGVKRLKGGQRPPMPLLLQWVKDAETISETNRLINAEAARLTSLFEAEGAKTAILKGPANDRLYPCPDYRQPGDIDIWVDGGEEHVLRLLQKMGWDIDERDVLYHHVHIPTSPSGIAVEVHFRPSSGNLNQRTNKRLQEYLVRQLTTGTSKCAEGFRVPSMPFSLIMQLAHIQRHVLTGGVGLRQVLDYYMLLLHSSAEERLAVTKQLRRLGLYHVASALMWVIEDLLHADKYLLLTQLDCRRGRWLLRQIVIGGNFGQHSNRERQGVWRYFIHNRMERLRCMWFSPTESMYFIKAEMDYWFNFFRQMPLRFKYRTLSLRDMPFERGMM